MSDGSSRMRAIGAMGVLLTVVVVAGFVALAAPSAAEPALGTSRELDGDLRAAVPTADPTGSSSARFVDERPTASGHPPPAVPEPLGRLDVVAEQRLAQNIQACAWSNYGRWEQECAKPGSGPNGEKTLGDALVEMEMLLIARKTEAASQLVRQGDYRTFAAAPGEGSKAVEEVPYPKGWSPNRTYNAAEIDGKMVDVLALVSPDDPLVAPLRNEISLMRSVKEEQEQRVFNALPDAVRRDRITKHIEAVRKIRQLGQDPTIGAEERDARMRTLLAEVLPVGWAYSVSTYTVGPASR